jgi:hypothetical protein
VASPDECGPVCGPVTGPADVRVGDRPDAGTVFDVDKIVNNSPAHTASGGDEGQVDGSAGDPELAMRAHLASVIGALGAVPESA